MPNPQTNAKTKELWDLRSSRWTELMALAQQGDANAYQGLLIDLSAVAQSFFRRRIADISSAEDLVQEVLISVHGARHSYNPKRPFGPWFFSILRRRYIDYLRRVSRLAKREYITDEPEINFNVGDREGGIAEILDFQTLLKKLPERQREAFSLVKIRGLSVAEAARESGMSESMVKVSVHRAKRSLQKKLDA